MSTGAPSAAQKINLRRPDIMNAVQAQVLSHYRSDLVERIRANGHILSAGELTIKLAKEFGFHPRSVKYMAEPQKQFLINGGFGILLSRQPLHGCKLLRASFAG